MLMNGRSLAAIIEDKSFDRRISGKLKMLQDEHWRYFYAILKANLLFICENEQLHANPLIVIVIEDCMVELADDNQTGMPYSFDVKSKTTKRVFTFATDEFHQLEQWIHYLTVSSLEYMNATLQAIQAQHPNVKADRSAIETKSNATPMSNNV